jgi:hypothetical protein
VQLVPQCAAWSVVLHAPSEHWTDPAPHPCDEQPLLVQTWPLVHMVQLAPQCAVLDATHWPPHETKPDEQVHDPLEQALPVAQALPHDPQF